ncbi:protein kinase domain-containing protein [Arcobacter sp. YIC-464]|uniref:protein kinase domain-containing protein n=1 Tax=Arcobacter sp. YIC-464 TaxID=3376631 RepID=UPI003C1B8861
MKFEETMIFSGQSEWECIETKPFAQGGNSYVYKVSRSTSQEIFALKLYKSEQFEGERYERFLEEINIVKELSNISGCIKYIDHGLSSNRPFYVMPYYSGGTYRSKYLNDKNANISPIQKLEDFQKLLQIVKELHDEGLAIRDIKPQNILLDEKNEPILADFGLSLWINTCNEDRMTPEQGSIGSQGYRPPEWASNYPLPDHSPGDIWSLGRTLWAIFAGKNAPNNYETLGGNGTHLNLYLPKEYANIVQSIVTSCTSQSPNKRPSIDDLITQVDVVKDDIIGFMTERQQAKKSINDKIRLFSSQIKNSNVYIDSQRDESETNIRLNEISESLNLICRGLEVYAKQLREEISTDIGSFRTNNSDWNLMFSLESAGLTIDYSDNNHWNKSVGIRFDPSNKLQDHKDMSYVYLNFYMGFTNDKEFYWLVASRDQTNVSEYIVEQFTCKSLSTVANQKLKSLESLVYKHFVARIEAHFKA